MFGTAPVSLQVNAAFVVGPGMDRMRCCHVPEKSDVRHARLSGSGTEAHPGNGRSTNVRHRATCDTDLVSHETLFIPAKSLNLLVGALGLEPRTR